MKWRVLTSFFMATAFLSPVHARLSDTPEQCKTRYGEVISSESNDPAQTRFQQFQKDGFDIIVTYANGKCVQIQFIKSNLGEITEVERRNLLRDNGENSEWSSEPVEGGNTRYVRRDGNATGVYDIKSKTLMLTNAAWLESERVFQQKRANSQSREY